MPDDHQFRQFSMIKIGHCLDLTSIQSANLKFLSNPESKKENGKVMKQKALNTQHKFTCNFSIILLYIIYYIIQMC